MTACRQCGAEADGRRFCTRCGAELAAPPAPNQGGPSPYTQPAPSSDPRVPRLNLRPKNPRPWLLPALVVALAAIGVTVGVLLYSHGHTSGTAAGQLTVSASTSPSSSSSPDFPSSSPVSSPSSSPTSSPAVHPSSSTGPGNSTVAVSSAAAHDPLAATAVTLLTRYFTAINTRNYTRWRSVFAPDYRGNFTPAGFAGYASTKDSGARITGMSPTADGRDEVRLTFTSTQDASYGQDGETCTVWKLRFYLEQVGTRSLFGRPPANYAYHSPC